MLVQHWGMTVPVIFTHLEILTTFLLASMIAGGSILVGQYKVFGELIMQLQFIKISPYTFCHLTQRTEIINVGVVSKRMVLE